MNVKEKFIWDGLLVITVILVIISGYFLYQMDVEKTSFTETYENETVGSDATLTRNITQLEDQFVERQNFKFKIKDYPTDLSRVIIFDAGALRGFGGSKVHFSAGIQGKINHAIAHYKNQIIHVTVGDSVAGGIVKAITAAQVLFEKDNETTVYSMIPEIDLEKEHNR